MTAIREITKVKPGRTVEVFTPDLAPGERVEVIVLASVAQTPPQSMGRRLKLDWGGALADLADQYTSVELQHKANERRGN